MSVLGEYDLINESFMIYLNRYLTGISLLKDEIKKIYVGFELSEAFSNHCCRFYVDLQYFDYNSISQEKKLIVNKYLYTHFYSNDNGNGFISFSYKPQSVHHIDFDIIKSFIIHYNFAASIFNNSIKYTLPENCILEVEKLNSNSFFNYIIYFEQQLSYKKDNSFNLDFNSLYKSIMHSSFDFDVRNHFRLTELAIHDVSNFITDKYIYECGGGSINCIRRFVINNSIPFSILLYNEVISQISVDSLSLINILKQDNIISKLEFIDIDRYKIIKLIEDKQFLLNKQNALLNEISINSGISIGNYIFLGDEEAKQFSVGLIKGIKIYEDNSIYIEYSILNQNTSESRRSSRVISYEKIFYTLKPELLLNQQSRIKITNINQLISFMIEYGILNKIYKIKRKIKPKKLNI